MPDLNISLSYPGHRKTKRLIAALGRDADILPIRLWAYVGDAHPETGELKGYTASEIESFAGWRGKPGKCLESLVSIGWLDPIEGGYKVHDWEEHQGHLAAFKIRGRNAALARWKKAKGKSIEDATSIATSIPEEVPPECSDGADLRNGHETKKPPAGDFQVEPPPGMPETEEQARFIGEKAGVPGDKAVKYWNALAAVGWMDGYRRPVRDFGRHAKIRFENENDRNAREAARTTQRPGGNKSYELKNVEDAKRARADSIRKKYASECAAGVTWADAEKRQEYHQLIREANELQNQRAKLL